MTDRNDNCTTCGGFGFTVEYNGEEEFMTGCHECFVAAHEADKKQNLVAQLLAMPMGEMVDTMMEMNPGCGIVDIAKWHARVTS